LFSLFFSGANPTTFQFTYSYNASVVVGRLERFFKVEKYFLFSKHAGLSVAPGFQSMSTYASVVHSLGRFLFRA
jgi:hypothetical protein